MGYSSEVVIAIHKTIMARHLITNEFPTYLRTRPPYQVGDAFYWRIQDIKWYADIPVIQEIENYFYLLEDEPPVAGTEDKVVFGACRVGGDPIVIEEWGNPFDYGISTYTHIDGPK